MFLQDVSKIGQLTYLYTVDLDDNIPLLKSGSVRAALQYHLVYKNGAEARSVSGCDAEVRVKGILHTTVFDDLWDDFFDDTASIMVNV